MVSRLEHVTKSGEKFSLGVKKRNLSPKHDYWLYIIETEHEEWGNRAYSVFVTKAAFPSENLADVVGKSLALGEVKERLEQADKDGMPLYWPAFAEGWAVL